MLQALLFSGIYECLLVGALFLVVHMVLGNMVEPRMMGHRLGMSTWWCSCRCWSGAGCWGRWECCSRCR